MCYYYDIGLFDGAGSELTGGNGSKLFFQTRGDLTEQEYDYHASLLNERTASLPANHSMQIAVYHPYHSSD